ncbi:MAG: tetratricopeptide repeat protein, partial [Proteobacteria bacterium]|nr:tetratricopeptide repeat protein [Pseudomonadota bacterium]
DALCDKLHARDAYCARAGLAPETLAEAPSPAPAAPVPEEASPAPASAQPGAAESAQTLESVVDEAASTVSGHEAARTPKAGREPIRIERSQGRPSSDVSRMVTVVNESDYIRDRYAAARRALGAGQTEGALKIYEDLLGRYPNNRLALLGKANALHRLGRVGDAIRVYEETLSRYPDEMAALTNLLGLIGRQSPQNALGRLRRLYRVNPGFGPVAAQMALIHAQLGDHGNALRYMKEALALEPRNPVYQVNVAIMSDRAGDKREAVRAYERTLELIAADTTALPISPPAIRDRLRYLRAN